MQLNVTNNTHISGQILRIVRVCILQTINLHNGNVLGLLLRSNRFIKSSEWSADDELCKFVMFRCCCRKCRRKTTTDSQPNEVYYPPFFSYNHRPRVIPSSYGCQLTKQYLNYPSSPIQSLNCQAGINKFIPGEEEIVIGIGSKQRRDWMNKDAVLITFLSCSVFRLGCHRNSMFADLLPYYLPSLISWQIFEWRQQRQRGGDGKSI